jgi:hypothetical protein
VLGCRQRLRFAHAVPSGVVLARGLQLDVRIGQVLPQAQLVVAVKGVASAQDSHATPPEMQRGALSQPQFSVAGAI